MSFKLKADSQNRVNKFVSDILENKKVFYILHPEDGAIIFNSNEFFDENGIPAPIIPVWSSTFLPYAKKYADALEIIEIDFEEFHHQMLPAMIQDVMILGLN